MRWALWPRGEADVFNLEFLLPKPVGKVGKSFHLYIEKAPDTGFYFNFLLIFNLLCQESGPMKKNIEDTVIVGPYQKGASELNFVVFVI